MGFSNFPIVNRRNRMLDYDMIVVTRAKVRSLDQKRMRDLYLFTARTMETDHPVPYGALIVNTNSGERLRLRVRQARREVGEFLYAIHAVSLKALADELQLPHNLGYGINANTYQGLFSANAFCQDSGAR